MFYHSVLLLIAEPLDSYYNFGLSLPYRSHDFPQWLQLPALVLILVQYLHLNYAIIAKYSLLTHFSEYHSKKIVSLNFELLG